MGDQGAVGPYRPTHAVSCLTRNGVAAAIANVPFVVTSEIMEKTGHNDLADVLLPATGWR